MNIELAKSIKDIIIEKWTGIIDSLSSEQIQRELTAKGIEIREGEMGEILDTFIKAGVIEASKFVDRDAIKEHGAMAIMRVNIPLLRELEFD
jgi:hypothetical protein